MNITLEKACKLINDKYPNKRILGCNDYGDDYGFHLVSRKWNGDIEDRPVDSTFADTVNKKDGTISYIMMTDPFPENKGVLNVLPYLSEEDRNFATEVKHKYDNRK